LDFKALVLHNFLLIFAFQVFAYCEHHKTDPVIDENEKDDTKNNAEIVAWDAEFLKMELGEVFELILVNDVFVQFSKIVSSLGSQLFGRARSVGHCMQGDCKFYEKQFTRRSATRV
jgi:hypothetical protein